MKSIWAKSFVKYIQWTGRPLLERESPGYECRKPGTRAVLRLAASIIGCPIAVLKRAYRYSYYNNVLIFSDWGTTELYYKAICEGLNAKPVRHSFRWLDVYRVLNLWARLPFVLYYFSKIECLTIREEDIRAIVWSYLRAISLIETHRPKGIVVLSQHSVTCRALISVANERGITTIYHPHAPTANNAAYEDMPVHIAALWSKQDVEIYQQFSKGEGLKSVGNPTIPTFEGEPFNRTTVLVPRYIYAPSPFGRKELIRQFKLLQQFNVECLHVCLHPRMNKADISALANEYLPYPVIFAPKRVVQFSAAGDVVFTSSSGAALDALRNHSIIVDLTAIGNNLSYYYLRDEIILKYRDFTLLELENRISYWQSNMQQYHVAASNFFCNWVSFVGVHSIERIQELLDNIESRASNKVIYDRYSQSKNA